MLFIRIIKKFNTLTNRNDHYCVHKNQPQDTILSRYITVPIFILYISNIHFNIILQPVSMTLMCSVPLIFSNKPFVRIFCFTLALCTSHSEPWWTTTKGTVNLFTLWSTRRFTERKFSLLQDFYVRKEFLLLVKLNKESGLQRTFLIKAERKRKLFYQPRSHSTDCLHSANTNSERSHDVEGRHSTRIYGLRT